MKFIEDLFTGCYGYVLIGIILEGVLRKIYLWNWFMTVVIDLLLSIAVMIMAEIIHRKYFVRRRKRK